MKTGQLLAVILVIWISGCIADDGVTKNSAAQIRSICQEPRPQICTMDYRPVCAVHQNGSEKTYSNACSACANPQVVSYIPDACPQP